MSPVASQLKSRRWSRDKYFISTDWSLIPIEPLNAAFASDSMYWAKPLPPEVMREILQNSLCFGLYKLGNDNVGSKQEQTLATGDSVPMFIGFARCITDFTTLMYLTDVWVDPAQQGKGLGTWLVSCVQEVIEDMPYLRRSMLLTSDWERSVPFYEKLMDMEVVQSHAREGIAIMTTLGVGHPDYKAKDGD